MDVQVGDVLAGEHLTGRLLEVGSLDEPRGDHEMVGVVGVPIGPVRLLGTS